MVGIRALLVSAGALFFGGCATSPSTHRSEPARPYTIKGDPLSTLPAVERRTLPNGLTVLISEDHRVPVVAVRVTYRVGAANDPPGRSELSHLVEHLLFGGSRHVPRGDHAAYLTAAGALDMNGTTDLDVTDLWEVVPASELAPALWLESDRMAFGMAAVSEADVERERRIVVAERGERTESVTAGALPGMARAELLPPGHPYRAQVQGPELEGVTLAEVRAFHARHYTPSNAVLVIAGDVEGARTWPLVERYFGAAVRGTDPERLRAPAFTPTARTVEAEARLENSALLLVWAAPAAGADGNAELDAWAMALNRRLGTLVEARLCDGYWVRQRSFALTSFFELWLDVSRGVDPSTLAAAVNAKVADLARDARRDSLVEETTRACLLEAFGGADSLAERSQRIAREQLLAGSPSFLPNAVRRFRAVSPESFVAAGTKYLSRERALTVRVSGSPDAPRQGRLRSP